MAFWALIMVIREICTARSEFVPREPAGRIPAGAVGRRAFGLPVLSKIIFGRGGKWEFVGHGGCGRDKSRPAFWLQAPDVVYGQPCDFGYGFRVEALGFHGLGGLYDAFGHTLLQSVLPGFFHPVFFHFFNG